MSIFSKVAGRQVRTLLKKNYAIVFLSKILWKYKEKLFFETLWAPTFVSGVLLLFSRCSSQEFHKMSNAMH